MATIVHSNAVPVATVAAFASMVGSIPGCLLTSLDLLASNHSTGARISLRAQLLGWSPSLHEKSMRWTSLIPKGWDVPDIANPDFLPVLTRMFGAKLAFQRSRATAALAVGAALPMTVSDHALPIDHMHADRGALILALRMPRSTSRVTSRSFANSIRQMVSCAHQDAVDYNGGARLEGNGGMIEEVGMRDATLRTVRVSASLGGIVSMWGSHLQLRGTDLPDTMVAAAVGRRLGDLVDVDPVLASRTILDAGRGTSYDKPTLWFDLAPDPVPLRPIDAVDEDRLHDILSKEMRP